MSEQNERSNLGDTYDQATRRLADRPDAVCTSVTTIKTQTFTGIVETWTIQTYRHPKPTKKKTPPPIDGKEDRGDTILLEHGSGERYLRLAVPPEVSDAIARQRDALTTKNRRKGAQRAVQTRAEKGIVPAFLKNPNRGRRRAKRSVTK